MIRTVNLHIIMSFYRLLRGAAVRLVTHIITNFVLDGICACWHFIFYFYYIFSFCFIFLSPIFFCLEVFSLLAYQAVHVCSFLLHLYCLWWIWSTWTDVSASFWHGMKLLGYKAAKLERKDAGIAYIGRDEY